MIGDALKYSEKDNMLKSVHATFTDLQAVFFGKADGDTLPFQSLELNDLFTW